SFTWDASRPGSPTVAATSNPTTGHSCPLSPAAPAYPVGTLCSFTLSPPVGSSISGYLYQLNQSAPLTTNSTGSATITLTLPRIVNTLTVSALSPGGNVGSDVTVTVDVTTLNPPANDGDLTGDGTADLIIPGNVSTASNTPPGLWLASGNPGGTVNSTAVNIGINGLGYSSPGAADWNGAQAISGNYCGLGTQDVLAYVPGAYDRTTNPNGGGGAIVCGDTSGAPLHVLNPVSGAQYTIFANTFQDPGTQINATQIAGGGSENDVDLGGTYDLYYGTITTDATNNIGQLDVFAAPSGNPNAIAGAIDLSNQTTPTGGTDWNHWTITTAQLPSGTAMYLWDSTTGDLYLWTGITLNANSLDQATGITYTTHPKIASGWHTGAGNLQLRAADINADGTPDLWAVTTTPGSTPTSTAYLLTNLTPTTATLTAQPAQNLTATAHTWLLNDNTTGTAASAADSTGTLTLTGTSGATWNTGDMYNPDVAFNGTSGYLNTASAAVTPNTNFTVSAWVKPTVNNGGVIFSQDGTNDSAILLYPNGSQWEFGMNNNNTNTWSYDGSVGGSYLLGVWTHLTLTYNATTKALTLYDNGVQASSITATNPPTTTGKFVIGADQGGGARGAYFNGQIADLQIWTSTQTPLPDTTHTWLLDDATTGAATTARDTTTGTAAPTALTGTSGATWHTADTFSPDVQLDSTSGALRAPGAAVTPNAGFTISAWAKPTAAGGVLFSQDGTNDSALLVYPGPSSWIFGINNAATTGWSFNSVGGGTISLNTWTHVVAVYNATTAAATLYLNGTAVASFTDTAPPTTTGAFQLGDDFQTNTHNAYFNGQIADARTWSTALTPTQVAAIN
ncbi:LamG domain-containing protein, partial [Actinocrinis puniceicyclus]